MKTFSLTHPSGEQYELDWYNDHVPPTDDQLGAILDAHTGLPRVPSSNDNSFANDELGLDYTMPKSQLTLAASSNQPSRPDSRTFWNMYKNVSYDTYNEDHNPDDHLKVWDAIGGSLGKWGRNNAQETCAARVSYALNRSGAPIKNIPNINIWSNDGDPNSNENKDKKYYIVRVEAMRQYLRHIWGKPDFSDQNTAGVDPSSTAFLKKYGIYDNGLTAIAVGNGHVAVIRQGYKDPWLHDSENTDIWLLRNDNPVHFGFHPPD